MRTNFPRKKAARVAAFSLSKKPSRRNQMESVISGGVYVGNDTSHERQSDFFLGPHKNHGFPGGPRETVVFVGEEEQRRERVSGFTRIQAIRSL